MNASAVALAANPAYAALRAEITSVLEILEGSGPLSDESVHAVRTGLKKARAALRLLRDEGNEDAYRAENQALRDAARCFSPLRDAKSQADAFDALTHRYADALEKVELRPLRRVLRRHQTTARRALFRTPLKSQDCTRLLKGALKGLDQSSLATVEAGLLPKRLKRIYRKGRKAYGSAKKTGSPETLHEWRKQVKYLLNARPILSPAKKDRAPKGLKRVRRLGHELGDVHDLHVLATEIAQADRSTVDAHARKALQTLIAERVAKLQKRALRRGNKLYKHTPRIKGARCISQAHERTAVRSTSTARTRERVPS